MPNRDRALDLHLITQQRPAIDAAHVDCLKPLLSVDDVEGQILSLLEGLVLTVQRLDAAVVHKDILALVLAFPNGDKTVAIHVVEPLADANVGPNFVVGVGHLVHDLFAGSGVLLFGHLSLMKVVRAFALKYICVLEQVEYCVWVYIEMHVLLVAVLVILVVAYVWSNLKYNTQYQILQLKPQQLTHDVLSERNPIVVEGKDIQGILEGAMRSMYVKKRIGSVGDSQLLHKNGARFALFFHNEDSKAVIEIATPKHAKMSPEEEDYQTVSVVLDKKHVLILPLFWSFKVSGCRVAMISAHDVSSLIYDFCRFSLSSRPR